MSEDTARRAGTNPNTDSRREFLRRTVTGGIAAASALWVGSVRAAEGQARTPVADDRARRIARIARQYGPEFGGGTSR